MTWTKIAESLKFEPAGTSKGRMPLWTKAKVSLQRCGWQFVLVEPGRNSDTEMDCRPAAIAVDSRQVPFPRRQEARLVLVFLVELEEASAYFDLAARRTCNRPLEDYAPSSVSGLRGRLSCHEVSRSQRTSFSSPFQSIGRPLTMAEPV